MPSESALPADVLAVLRALAPAAAPWREAVVGAAEDVRGMLAGPGTAAAAAHSLGAFAAGRIDLERFAGFVSRSQPIEDASLVRLRVALDTLLSLASRPPEALLAVSVPRGSRARDCVAAAFEEIGRAFGAAHEVAEVRRGAARGSSDATMHQGYAFARWTRRERLLAPPLVVEIAGADLAPADLAEFLDGAVRIALVVRGPCAPAPLVRLVSPGTFVLQTSDAAAFARLAATDGPGVAALVPEAAAAFVHDPRAGRAPWDRTHVDRAAADGPRRAVGTWSPEQQAEELRQLAALAFRPSAAAMSAAAAALPANERGAVGDDPAGRLAAWLLEASGAPSQARHG